MLVKEVPDVTAPRRIDPGTGRLDRSGEGRLNPYDAHAIEAAVGLRERGVVVDEVVAVSMGPPSAARILQQALSRGADRSIHLSDPVLAGSDLNGTAHALSRVLAREAPDLVLLGQQSADADCYSLAAAIGEHLGAPSLSQVVEMDPRDGRLSCRRQAEYGYDRVSVELPAVIAVAEGINEPRYPALRAMMAARTKPLETLTAEQAGVESSRVGHASARALCTSFTPPPQRAAGQLIDDPDPDAAVRAMVDWLETHRLLA